MPAQPWTKCWEYSSEHKQKQKSETKIPPLAEALSRWKRRSTGVVRKEVFGDEEGSGE